MRDHSFIPVPLVGMAVGDALGAPFEFSDPATDRELLAWDGVSYGRGVFGTLPGQYTDDTMMALCLTRSMVACRGLVIKDVLLRYIAWRNEDKCRGIGITCSGSIADIEYAMRNGENIYATPRGTESRSNGAAMRCAPIGMVYRRDYEQVAYQSWLDASMTHNNHESVIGAMFTALCVAHLCNGETKVVAVSEALRYCVHYAATVNASNTKIIPALEMAVAFAANEAITPTSALDQIGTGGFAFETVPASVFCLLRGTDFMTTVAMAVRGGGDADTTGAVVGAMAGSLYGMDGIPNSVFAGLEDNQELLNLDIQCAELLGSNG